MSAKAALVTGASRRIGRCLVETLAEDGWTVALHYNASADEAEAVARDVAAKGGSVVPVRADLTSPDIGPVLIDLAAQACGAPLTLLVNNASVFEPDEVETVSSASFDAHQTVNLRAPLLLSQAFASQVPDGTEGNIVNIIDQRVWRLTPRFLSYTVSKAGLWTLTQILAQALAPDIRVNGIGPGPTLANPRQDQETFRQQQAATILQRGADLSEFAGALRFLLGTPSLTGQMIALDGGQHLAWQTPDATLPE